MDAMKMPTVELPPVDDPIFAKETPEHKADRLAQQEAALDRAHAGLFGGSTKLDPVVRFGRSTAEFTNELGLESTQEHRRIAKVWQEKCKLLPELLDSERELAKRKWDARDYPVRHLALRRGGSEDRPSGYVLEDGPHAGQSLTGRGFSTLAAHVGAPADFIEKLIAWGETDLALANVNTLVKRKASRAGEGEGATCTARFINPEEAPLAPEAGQLRCVASAGYLVINNLDALEMMADALGAGKVLASHMFNDNDRVYGNLFPEDAMVTQRGDSDYGLGIAFRNSECMQSAFSIRPFLFRAVCLNGCIWSRRDGQEILLDQRHHGKVNLDALREQVKTGIQAAMGQSEALLKLFMLNREAKVELPNAVIAHLCRAHELTQEQGKRWSAAFLKEQEFTGFGIINGLTAAAQTFKGERREQMEMLAGDLIAPSLKASIDTIRERWDLVNLNARQLEEEEPQLVRNYAIVF